MHGCHRRMVCSAMRHIGKQSYGCGLRIDNRPLTSARCRHEAKLALNAPPDLRSDRSSQVDALDRCSGGFVEGDQAPRGTVTRLAEKWRANFRIVRVGNLRPYWSIWVAKPAVRAQMLRI